MKHLPKHLRPRWRYLAVDLEAWPDADLDRRAFREAVWRSARTLLGDADSADAAIQVLGFEFDRGVGEAVVRARRGHVGEARAAIACVDAVAGDPVRATVRGVSGTVRACEEKYLGRRAELRDTNVVYRNADRRAVERNGLVDVRQDRSFTGATRLDIE